VLLLPYRPDLKLLDYRIWGVMQAKVSVYAYLYMSSLKQTILQVLAAKERQNCHELRPCLEKVVAVGGSYSD
jgi:hypothetical protein